PKGATVTIVGIHSDGKSAVVRHVKGGEPFTKRLDSMERIFRTTEERELGRDFTPEEAAAYQQRFEIRIATLGEENSRTAIAENIERIAQGLERAAADIRQELAYDQTDPAEKAKRAQHTVAWLMPNLVAHD